MIWIIVNNLQALEVFTIMNVGVPSAVLSYLENNQFASFNLGFIKVEFIENFLEKMKEDMYGKTE